MRSCERRYADGSLYMQESADGEQLYFYPSGALKSRIPYVEGRLEGTVRLYYPNGRLKRWVEFRAGERCGAERFWDEEGKLLLESYFDQVSSRSK